MNYHNLTYPDMNNGDGLRVVLWVSGCFHHCYECQNPQTWSPYSGIPFDEAAKRELFKELNKEYISGITLSGGDPLHKNNLIEVLKLTDEIRLLSPEKTIWIYSGYTWEEIMPGTHCKRTRHECNLHNLRAKIIENCNVFVDGRYVDSKRDIALKWRGSSNQRVINVQKSIENGYIVLWSD